MCGQIKTKPFSRDAMPCVSNEWFGFFIELSRVKSNSVDKIGFAKLLDAIDLLHLKTILFVVFVFSLVKKNVIYQWNIHKVFR
jgi:hypothetical protein